LVPPGSPRAVLGETKGLKPPSKMAEVQAHSLSGRLDLNQRPLAPQASALPGCATPRCESPAVMPPRSRPVKARPRSLRGQHFGDRGDRVPIARRRRHPENLVDLAQVADRLHVAPVLTEDEAVVASDDSNEPAVGGKIERKRREDSRALRQNAHEANHAVTERLASVRIARKHLEDVASPADHHLSFERQPPA